MVEESVIQAEVDRFLELMDIDAGDGDLEPLARAIRNNSVVINEKGEPEFTPVRSDDKGTIVFHEPTGAAIIAAASKENQATGGFSALAEVTGQPPQRFSKMAFKDVMVCLGILGLFMGASESD